MRVAGVLLMVAAVSSTSAASDLFHHGKPGWYPIEDDGTLAGGPIYRDMWLQCIESHEAAIGMSLGVAGAQACWVAHRNLRSRHEPITEATVPREMGRLMEGQERTYDPSCLARIHYPAGEHLRKPAQAARSRCQTDGAAGERIRKPKN